jgi:hypothetical protein
MTVCLPGGDESDGLASQGVDDEELSSVRESNGCESDCAAVIVVSDIDVTEVRKDVASLSERDAMLE